MSALNFIIDENYVAVSTDTLSLSATTREPYKLLDKAFLLSQMNCIIAGTGNVMVLLKWVQFVRERAYANGIHYLDLIAQQSLEQVVSDQIITEDISATIYQFGLSEVDNSFHGYAYRSTNKFKSEKLAYGLGIKPIDAFDDNDKKQTVFSSFDDSTSEALEASFVKLMCQQKRYDDALPKHERLGIGGKVQLLLMTRGVTLSKALYTFPDIEDDLRIIEENLS